MNEQHISEERGHIERELYRQATERGVKISSVAWKTRPGDNHVLEFRVNERREMINFDAEQLEGARRSSGIDLIQAKVRHCLGLSKSGAHDAIRE
jgi:hypothetical protein